VKLEIEVHGDVQVSRELLRFADRQEDASPAFESIMELLRRSQERQFEGGGKHASGGWAKLKQATIDAKARSSSATVRRNTKRILVAMEALMESFTARSHGADGATRVIQPRQMIFGSQVRHGRFHQPDPQGRRALEVRARDRTEMVKRVQRHMVKGRV
jgi:hypothetical protein